MASIQPLSRVGVDPHADTLAASGMAKTIDSDRSDDDPLRELSGLRNHMKSIEGWRIDMGRQAIGGHISMSGTKWSVKGMAVNKGIEESRCLPRVQARIGSSKEPL